MVEGYLAAREIEIEEREEWLRQREAEQHKQEREQRVRERERQSQLELELQQRRELILNRCILACDQPRAYAACDGNESRRPTIQVGDFVRSMSRGRGAWRLAFVSGLGCTVDPHGRRYPNGLCNLLGWDNSVRAWTREVFDIELIDIEHCPPCCGRIQCKTLTGDWSELRNAANDLRLGDLSRRNSRKRAHSEVPLIPACGEMPAREALMHQRQRGALEDAAGGRGAIDSEASDTDVEIDESGPDPE